ncbi:MAG: nuclear transport factor 2 family protein [Proteobacteria bacterium]|nr:nuclear transport factor 2 family protein [Pseudomonadota bacterium]
MISIEETLAGIERCRLRALVAADMQTAAPLHAPDFQLITPRGQALSKTEYLEAVRRGDIHYLRWEPGEIHVRVVGNAAVLRYRATLQLEVSGEPRPAFVCWHTDTYELGSDGWQVVWSQATKID